MRCVCAARAAAEQLLSLEEMIKVINSGAALTTAPANTAKKMHAHLLDVGKQSKCRVPPPHVEASLQILRTACLCYSECNGLQMHACACWRAARGRMCLWG